ncbi:unnamed protein product [Cunninghamella blakesleeana]
MAPPGDVRKLLRQQQTQRQQDKKIEHAFAKYDNQGRLGCVICEIVIKTEQLWGSHLQSSQHKEKIAKLKAIKQQQQQNHLSKKRPIDDTPSSSNNGGDAALLSKRARFDQIEKEFEEEQEEDDDDEEEGDDDDESMDENNEENELPADFFDTPTKATTATATTTKMNVQHDLPTGFFDDPDEEAKVKQIANPKELQEQKLNDEYEAFKELMAETIEETDKIQEQDEETVLLDRDITLARQQLELDEKVQRLKYLRNQPTELLLQEINKKKSGGQKNTFTKSNTNNTVDDDDDSLWTTGLKSSVRQVMKKNDNKKQPQPIFEDDMDEDEDEDEDDEGEDGKDWRAQHI